ncbi:MAG: copper chaperone PCu(A)C [Undibacterium sp.]|uniref:copper chaperone PCu(A)C n=1 Tax=Undibacterium sp. TaxID=1914977 RepID=UPI0027221D00|nr:copper chaperone PCu(A)C [Undibacterium sp.]MDO8652426.1 copper chaperone PCu(A)C [Undibacterium sp.]
MKKLLLSTLITVCLASTAQAQVSVKDAWVRATVAQQKVTGAFMQITSGKDTRLVEVHSSAAATVELHQMEMVGDVMKMHAIDELALPAGKTVELKPGGYHVMLMGLKAQVKEGDTIPLTLVIEGKDKKRETIELKAIAKPLNQAAMPAMQHH